MSCTRPGKNRRLPCSCSTWNTLKELASHLHRSDVLVMSVPLWNFSIPYKLKHFIDLVSKEGIMALIVGIFAVLVAWNYLGKKPAAEKEITEK